jgi:hypothetical protein
VSSIEPNGAGCEVDGGEEVAGGFVVASGDGPELLEPGEEILDQVAFLVEVAIIVTWLFTVRFRRNDRGLGDRCQRLDHPLIGIEGLVGDECVGLHVWQQVIGTDKIVRLATGQVKANWIPKCIDKCVDLGAQPAAGAANGLVFTLFFWAPALC